MLNRVIEVGHGSKNGFAMLASIGNMLEAESVSNEDGGEEMLNVLLVHSLDELAVDAEAVDDGLGIAEHEDDGKGTGAHDNIADGQLLGVAKHLHFPAREDVVAVDAAVHGGCEQAAHILRDEN